MRGKYNHDHQKSTFLPRLCSSSSTHDQVQLCHRHHNRHRSSTVSEDEPSSPRVGCMGQVKRNNKINGFPTIISYSTNNIPLPSLKDYHKLNQLLSTNTNTTTTTRGSGVGTHKGKNNNNNIPSGVPPSWGLGKVGSTRSLYMFCKDRETVSSKAKKREIESRGDFHQGMRILCKSTSGENNNKDSEGKKGSLVNLEEMDPPLPVVKRIPKEEVEGTMKGESVSLWKRRYGGGAPLKSLQLQLIHHHHSHPLFSVDTPLFYWF